MFHIVYKITNLRTGRYYIGCHQTADINDGYMGSGKWIKRAIRKHGKEAFDKEILAVFDNSKEMFELESRLVDETVAKSDESYNLVAGGESPLHYINEHCHNNTNNHRKTGNYNWKYIKPQRDEEFVRIRTEGLRRYYSGGGKNPFEGKAHSKETKLKIGKANSQNQKGERNSQYGTCWIYHEKIKQNKKIKKSELSAYAANGWKMGRKIRKD